MKRTSPRQIAGPRAFVIPQPDGRRRVAQRGTVNEPRISSACGSQTNRYVLPGCSLTRNVFAPVPPTLVATSTPGPRRWKLWSSAASFGPSVGRRRPSSASPRAGSCRRARRCRAEPASPRRSRTRRRRAGARRRRAGEEPSSCVSPSGWLGRRRVGRRRGRVPRRSQRAGPVDNWPLVVGRTMARARRRSGRQTGTRACPPPRTICERRTRRSWLNRPRRGGPVTARTPSRHIDPPGAPDVDARLVAWVVFPIVLLAVTLGCGLALEAVAGRPASAAPCCLPSASRPPSSSCASRP